MSFKRRLFKQRNIGNWWGAIKQSAGQLNIYVAFINLFLLAVTAWNTTLSEWLTEAGIEIPFIVFALGIITFLFIAMVVEYKVSIPSFFSFWSSQFWEHDNPMRKKIEDMDKDIKAIKKLLEDK